MNQQQKVGLGALLFIVGGGVLLERAATPETAAPEPMPTPTPEPVSAPLAARETPHVVEVITPDGERFAI